MVDVKSSFGITGKQAETVLDEVNITCNKNTIPNDTEKPFITSGIRLGSPAMTTRGLKDEDFMEIGRIIYKTLKNIEDKDILDKYKKEVLDLTSKFPLYE